MLAAGVVGVTAQPRSAVSKADTVLLSERTDGNYQIRKSLVTRDADADYAIRYPINQATLQPSLSDNRQELDDMGALVGKLTGGDSLMQVKTITITGYASPDGPVQLNRNLAAKRAQDFKGYADKQYGLSTKCGVKTASVASDWADCRDAVERSNMPDKQAVLKVIDSSAAASAKEAQLKAMPAAWDYMKRNILPPMRCVEVEIGYADGTVVETRMLVSRPQQTLPAVPVNRTYDECPPADDNGCGCNCPCVIIDEQINGIIVEMDGNDVG